MHCVAPGAACRFARTLFRGWAEFEAEGACARFRRKPQVTTRTTPTFIRLAEESLEGASRTAWRRVAAFTSHLRAGVQGKLVQIEPALLEAALDKDRRQP